MKIPARKTRHFVEKSKWNQKKYVRALERVFFAAQDIVDLPETGYDSLIMLLVSLQKAVDDVPYGETEYRR